MAGQPQAPGRRVVRVFVSSSFRDMRAEREKLIKLVFPCLRQMCEQRGTAWVEAEPRWGITDEARERGRVPPLRVLRVVRPWLEGEKGRESN